MSAEYKREQARCLDGLLAGMCDSEEYEDLIEEGILYRSYEGVAGFMGLATLRMREEH